jgi:hypothetical protein
MTSACRNSKVFFCHNRAAAVHNLMSVYSVANIIPHDLIVSNAQLDRHLSY